MHNVIYDPQLQDPLARYLYSRGEYSSTKGEVKHRAFMPPKESTQLSVFQIRNLDKTQVWQLESKIAKKRGKDAKAYAEFTVNDVSQIEGLSVDPDNNPARHAHIVGFPKDKGAKMLKAMELASRKPKLRMRP